MSPAQAKPIHRSGWEKSMMQPKAINNPSVSVSRRSFLRNAGLGSLTLFSAPAWAETLVRLPMNSGPNLRPLTDAFPEKGTMILQRTRPPLLETPWETFDKGVFTPNDQFYTRWHWGGIPTGVDVDTFRLSVSGHVNTPLSLSLHELIHEYPRVELAAVNQCSGNFPRAFRTSRPGCPMG